MGWHESLLDTMDRPSIFIHTFKNLALTDLSIDFMQKSVEL